MILFVQRHSTFFIIFFLLVVASFFRLYKLPTIPFGLNHDAAWEGSAALDMMRGNLEPYIPYAQEGSRGEGIIRISVVPFMLLLGNDPVTIRLASIVFGIGLIIPLFFLVKNFFTKDLAFLTTFLVAISGWHITMSKTGWRAICVPFFATLCFYFLEKGFTTHKSRHFILSGIFFSIGTFYIYEAARILPILFVMWILYRSITIKSFLKIYKVQSTLFATAFLITSLPMMVYALNHWENFKSRSDFLFIGHQIEKQRSLAPLWENIKTSAFLFNVRANGYDFFISEPLVDKPVSWFFPIGFFLSLFYIIQRKNHAHLFMMLWFLISLLPGTLSVPNGNRAIGTIPSVYFFSALGIFTVTKALSQTLPRARLAIFLFGVVSILAVASYYTYHTYLSAERRELPGFYPETRVTTDYIKTIWNSYEIHLTDNYPRELLTYYLYREDQPNPFQRNYFWHETPTGFVDIAQTHLFEKRVKGLAFFMFANPVNEAVAGSLLTQFPQAEKTYIWYKNDMITRPASLLVTIPGQILK